MWIGIGRAIKSLEFMGDFLLFQNRKSSMMLYIRKKYKTAMRMKKGLTLKANPSDFSWCRSRDLNPDRPTPTRP